MTLNLTECRRLLALRERAMNLHTGGALIVLSQDFTHDLADQLAAALEIIAEAKRLLPDLIDTADDAARRYYQVMRGHKQAEHDARDAEVAAARALLAKIREAEKTC